MRIISLNVNGIRSAARKGFYDWLRYQRADFVCLQEIRAHGHQITESHYRPRRFVTRYTEAEKKGYSGVAIYSRHEPVEVVTGIDWAPFDSEARYIEFRYPNLSVVSLYMPSGSSGEVRQAFKFKVMKRLKQHFNELGQSGREVVVCGDYNIAHRQIDLKNWRSNQKNSGFLPEERAWMDWLYGPAGWVDTHRSLDPRPEQYTWWSNRGQAWAKNVGWRLDYQVATPGIARTATKARVYLERRFSDHAPVIIDYDMEIKA